MKDEQRKKLHKLVLEFAMYSQVNIPNQIENARTVLTAFPKDITNAPLCWLLNSSVKGALEALLNDLAQALDLVEKAANNLDGSASLQLSEEMRDAKRMRDTLLAHRMEVSISTEKHYQWYKERYGSFEKAFDLVEKVAAQIGALAWQLSRHEGFHKAQSSMSEPPLLKREDIALLLQTLKTSDIY